MTERIVEDGADIDVAGELYYVEYLLAPREDGDLDYLLTKVDRYGVGHRVSHSCIRPPVGVRAAVEALLATWGGGKWIVRHRPWGDSTPTGDVDRIDVLESELRRLRSVVCDDDAASIDDILGE